MTMEIFNLTESWTLSDVPFGSVISPEDSVYSKLYENFRSTLYKHKEVGTVILVVLYVPVFLMAFFGNLMVLLVVLPNRHMRNVTNFFIVNLAVADLTGNSFLMYQLYLVVLINVKWSEKLHSLNAEEFLNVFSSSQVLLQCSCLYCPLGTRAIDLNAVLECFMTQWNKWCSIRTCVTKENLN